MPWFAVMRGSDVVVATGATYLECSAAAFAACPWGESPSGGIAPYVLTTAEPPDISLRSFTEGDRHSREPTC